VNASTRPPRARRKHVMRKSLWFSLRHVFVIYFHSRSKISLFTSAIQISMVQFRWPSHILLTQMYTELYAADERSSMSRAPPHIDMLCYNLGIPHLKVDPLWVDESDVGEWHINYYFFYMSSRAGSWCVWTSCCMYMP
jgi:hypothetical protein